MRWIAALLLATTVSAADFERGKLIENVVTRADASQSYTLYLPTTYSVDKKLPVLLIFDPRGRGTLAAEIFREAAEEHHWILLSSNNTRSDEVVDPNEKALAALFPELQRWSHDPRRIYAAGFSGTALVACAVGLNTGTLAGVIGVGGRLVPQMPPAQFNFAHYGFAGERDFNNREMREIDALLDKTNKPHRFQSFDGVHQWMSPELAREAIQWMEVVAMQEGRRAKDEAFLAKAHAEDLAKANALGATLAGLRRHRAVLRTFGGDASIVAQLERDPNVRKALDEEAKWDDFEKRYLAEMSSNLQTAVAQKFRVPELQRRAKRGGIEGNTAQRLLDHVYGQTNRYILRELFARRDYRAAIEVLTIAATIHPDRWPVWYNLGAAYARAGERKRALDALEKAFANGFRNAKQLETDDDFASLRADQRYLALLASRSQ
jgi:predicted esterase